MKETGVIRRIDELGRIVIPKEVRKKLKIRSGDSIDIFIENDKIILEKYSALKDLEMIIQTLLDVYKTIYNAQIIISDMNKVVASNIDNVKHLEGLSANYISLIEKNNEIDLNNTQLTNDFKISTNSKMKSISIYGDLFGSILILDCNNKTIDLINVLHTFIKEYLNT